MEKQSLKQIKQLDKQGDTTKAFQAIQAYLQTNHDDLEAIKLYQDLKKKVYKQNLSKVKDSIQSVKFMWKQGRYKDLLHLYLKLRPYAPNYRPLENLIQKAYNAYHKEEMQKQDSANSKVIQNVEGYLKSKNYTEALKFIEEAIKRDLDNPLLQKLLVETKRKVIDAKLKANMAKIKKISIPESYDFIKKLYELEPTYYKIQKLFAEYHYKLKDYYKNQKFIYEKDAKRQIKVLYNTKEYDKALQATQELLKVNNTSKTAQKYLPRIKQKIDQENFKTAYQKIST